MAVVSVIDVGLCNLAAVRSAMEAAAGPSGEVQVARRPEELAPDGLIVLPGVAATDTLLRKLQERGFCEALHAARAHGWPILGLCAGFQAMFDYTEEGQGADGLGWFAGAVRRLDRPRIGWAWCGGAWLYHCHGFAADQDGEPILSARKGRILGFQGHPEKSGRAGIALLRSILAGQ